MIHVPLIFLFTEGPRTKEILDIYSTISQLLLSSPRSSPGTPDLQGLPALSPGASSSGCTNLYRSLQSQPGHWVGISTQQACPSTKGRGLPVWRVQPSELSDYAPIKPGMVFTRQLLQYFSNHKCDNQEQPEGLALASISEKKKIPKTKGLIPSGCLAPLKDTLSNMWSKPNLPVTL